MTTLCSRLECIDADRAYNHNPATVCIAGVKGFVWVNETRIGKPCVFGRTMGMIPNSSYSNIRILIHLGNC